MTEPLSPPPPAPPARPRRRTPVALLIVIGVLILLAGTALVLWQTGVLANILPGPGPAGPDTAGERERPRARPALAEVLPARTELYFSLRTDIERHEGYQRLLQVYGAIPEVAATWDDLAADLEAETGLSFAQDIKPWLGDEMALGVVGFETVLLGPYYEESPAPAFVIVLSSRDNRAADACLLKLRDYLEQEEGYQVVEEQYQGVTCYVPQPVDEWDEPPLWARIDDKVLIATDRAIMQETIDAVQGRGATLAQNEAYQRIAQALPPDAVAYLAYPGFGAAMRQSVQDSYSAMPGELTEPLEALQGLGMAVRLEKDGVQLDTVVVYDPQKLSAEALALVQPGSGDERVLEYIPADALGFYSAYDMGVWWRNFFQTLEQDRDFAWYMQDLGDELGLTIDGDLFEWMSGGFAIVLVKARGDVPLAGYGIFGLSDQQAAEDTVNTLAAALVRQLGGFITFSTASFDGVEMEVLRDPFSRQVLLGYGFPAGHLLLAQGEDAIRAALNPGVTITQSPTFQRVQAHLPRGHGYLYLDVEAAVELARGQMSDWEREDFEQNVLPYLAPIKAFGLAGEGDARGGVARTTWFIYIP